ncbi:enoyl-CoA hydratase-related protein [Paenalcaligenes sp. Me131]|uniref:enoyl-CoA hydratase-related protein n=1 Tax=Paenalcaligenes sp. Me131 TaxID=3392636 RepID=UPI003D293302
MSHSVQTRQEGAIWWVTLNRPSANAIDCATSQRLYEAFYEYENNTELRVAILTGSGQRFFSAGWDLKAAAEGEAIDANHGPGGFGGLTEYFSLSKPVIAAVNGLAVGGGFELALACDFVVAAEHAEFFLPELSLGIIPDSGGVFRLPRRLPRSVALELILTGRRLRAQEALQWGLLSRVTSSDNLLQAAQEFAEQLLHSAPLAQQAVKELLQATEHVSLPEAYALQRQAPLPHYRNMLSSDDAQEGIQAFSEKRAPVWRGQ